MVVFMCSKTFATTHYSTINSFAPATRQGSFTTLEEGDTLDYKNINAYIFLDVASQSLSIYGSSEEGEDILTFLHVGMSYGFTEKLEFGFRGQAVAAELNNDDQPSIEVASRGFTNFDGFVKYNFYNSSKLSLSTIASVGFATGDNIFFIALKQDLTFL